MQSETGNTYAVRAAVGTAVAGLVSTAHHLYGAIAYDTPWRLIVSLWIPGFVLIVLSALYLCRRRVGTRVGSIALWIFFLGAVVFQFGFTLFECVYSHVLKNTLYYGGASEEFLLRLFPPPAYHLPDNLLFEFTGLLQLIGLLAVWWSYQFVRGHYRSAQVPRFPFKATSASGRKQTSPES